MTLANWAVNHTIKNLTGLVCKVERESLQRVPLHGPLILVCNHVGSLEVPLLFTHLQPRRITGYAKAETWNSPLLGPLFDMWGAIPIRRGEIDLTALRRGLQALEQGQIFAISPEGTRSRDGRLRRGYPGVVTLALRSGAPLLPLVYYGGERLGHNLRRLRRTDFRINVGLPFRLELNGVKATAAVRRRITDEIMYQLAWLLPIQYRGEYADLEMATTDFIRF